MFYKLLFQILEYADSILHRINPLFRVCAVACPSVQLHLQPYAAFLSRSGLQARRFADKEQRRFAKRLRFQKMFRSHAVLFLITRATEIYRAGRYISFFLHTAQDISHSRQAALHIAGTSGIDTAIFLRRHRRIRLPLSYLAVGHRVQMPVPDNCFFRFSFQDSHHVRMSAVDVLDHRADSAILQEITKEFGQRLFVILTVDRRDFQYFH